MIHGDDSLSLACYGLLVPRHGPLQPKAVDARRRQELRRQFDY